jgi:hypothetical protein
LVAGGQENGRPVVALLSHRAAAAAAAASRPAQLDWEEENNNVTFSKTNQIAQTKPESTMNSTGREQQQLSKSSKSPPE